MGVDRLHQLLAGSETVLSAWSSLGDPVVHETLLRSFDVLTLDVQHGLQSVDEIREGCARAVLMGKPAVVRVPIGDLALAARSLDFGATGVILPMVEGPEDAAAFARALCYAPAGTRSYGPARAVDLFGLDSGQTYMGLANRSIVSLAMIETASAFRQIDAILAVPELGGIFVGPSDLSMAIGSTGLDPNSAEADEAARTLLAKAKEAGKASAIYAATAGDARRYREMGYGMICVASDIALLRAASNAIVRDIRA